uniref:Uncharacterized protein n=1 Tax=Arundo donax TaxID=35708 RepID=A0A0A8XTZ7_ARUDO
MEPILCFGRTSGYMGRAYKISPPPSAAVYLDPNTMC